MKPLYENYHKEFELKDFKIKSLEEELKIFRDKQTNSIILEQRQTSLNNFPS